MAWFMAMLPVSFTYQKSLPGMCFPFVSRLSLLMKDIPLKMCSRRMLLAFCSARSLARFCFSADERPAFFARLVGEASPRASVLVRCLAMGASFSLSVAANAFGDLEVRV